MTRQFIMSFIIMDRKGVSLPYIRVPQWPILFRHHHLIITCNIFYQFLTSSVLLEYICKEIRAIVGLELDFLE